MVKINLKLLPPDSKQLLLANLPKYFQKQSAAQLKKYISYLGIKGYKIIQPNKKQSLNKTQSFQAIMQYLEKNPQMRIKIVEQNYLGICELCLSNQERIQIRKIFKASSVDQKEDIKIAESQIQKRDMTVQQLQKQVSKIRSHHDKIILNFIKNIQNKKKIEEILQVKIAKQLKQIESKPKISKFQNTSPFLLQNNINLNLPLLALPISILQNFKIQRYPIFAEYSISTPKKYQIPVQQLKLLLPNQQISTFNSEIDSYLFQQPQKYRKNIKQIIFSHLKAIKEPKIGKNKIKSTSQALQILIKMKEIHFQSYFSQINPLIEIIKQKTLLLERNSQKQASRMLQEIFSDIEKYIQNQKKTKQLWIIIKIIEQIVQYLGKQILCSERFILKQHFLHIMHEKLQNILNQIKQKEQVEIGIKSIILMNELIKIFNKASLKLSQLKQKSIQNYLFSIGEKYCQFMLLGLTNLQFENKQALIQAYFLLESLTEIGLIIENRQKIMGDQNIQIVDLQQIFQTTEYQEVLSRAYHIFQSIFKEPSLQKYNQLINKFQNKPLKCPIWNYSNMINKFNLIFLEHSDHTDSSMKNSTSTIIYGMIFQLITYFYFLPAYQFQQSQTLFSLFITLLSKYEPDIHELIQNGESDSNEIKEKLSIVLTQLIIKFISSVEYSLKDTLQLIQVMAKFECFLYLNQKAKQQPQEQNQDKLTSETVLEFILLSSIDINSIKQQKDSEKIINFLTNTVEKFISNQHTKQKLFVFLQQPTKSNA